MMNPNMSMLAQMLMKNRLGQMPPAGGFNPGPMPPPNPIMRDPSRNIRFPSGLRPTSPNAMEQF